MPSFDYRCDACDEGFEARVVSARSRPACPRCGARRARRLPAAPSLHTSSSALAPKLPGCGGPACGCGRIERPSPAASVRS
jgi:putative FmdB family regulatory protein